MIYTPFFFAYFAISFGPLISVLSYPVDPNRAIECCQGRSPNDIIWFENNLSQSSLSGGHHCQTIDKCPKTWCKSPCVTLMEGDDFVCGCDSDLADSPREQLVCQKGPMYDMQGNFAEASLKICNSLACQQNIASCEPDKPGNKTSPVHVPFLFNVTIEDDAIVMKKELSYPASFNVFNRALGDCRSIKDESLNITSCLVKKEQIVSQRAAVGLSFRDKILIGCFAAVSAVIIVICLVCCKKTRSCCWRRKLGFQNRVPADSPPDSVLIEKPNDVNMSVLPSSSPE